MMPDKRTKTNREALKKTAILEALEKSLGVVTEACKAIGIGRTLFYKYVNEDEAFAAAVRDMDDVALDFVESALYEQIKNGIPSSTIFHLKTKGRKRGYSESLDIRQEVTQKLEDMTDEDIENQIKRLERIRNATKE